MRITLVKQQDETDCGAACIPTVAKSYGKRISIPKIRNLAGTDTKGTSAKGILKAAGQLGFTCKAIFSKEKKLKKDFPFPIIVHLKKEGLEHYEVLYKARKNKMLLADPAGSISWIKKDEFMGWWSGVFFFIVPSADFEKTNDSKSFFERFMYLLKRNKSLVVDVFIASFLLTILGVLSAFYFRYLIDEVIYSYLPQTLVSISIGFLIIIIFQTILNFTRNHLVMYLGNKIEASLILDYFNHILKLPIDFFMKRKSGEILSRLGDISTIKNALSSITVGVLLDSLMLVFGGIVLFKFSSSLIGIAVIPVLLSAILVLLFAKKFKKLIYNQSVLEADKYSHFVESVNGISTIKALSTETNAYDRAEIKILKTIQASFDLNIHGNIQSTLQNFFSQAGNLAVYWYGSWLIMNNKLSLGELISFVTLLGYFLGPLGRLICLQPQLQELSVASSRLGEILDLPTEEKINSGTTMVDSFTEGIYFKDLCFSYGTRGQTLKKINFCIKPGEKIAFVGPSGSGKTTLVKLLLKFYNPESGEIFIDNNNINDLNTKSYRDLFGYVPQEILLFSGTVAENIAWGKDDATPKKIFEASRDAGALEFIAKLEDRFQTKVGERGASLSGGERQRIALARVLLRKPKILLLDEATSSLDSISEARIMSTIKQLKKSSTTTTIIVAHRLSTIKDCDKIFVLKEGVIVEQGKHSELLAEKGVYSQMWISQNGGQQ